MSRSVKYDDYSIVPKHVKEITVHEYFGDNRVSFGGFSGYVLPKFGQNIER